MLDKIGRRLLDECRLSPDLPLLLAVSGGPDSLCLLHLLQRLGYRLVVAHFDHGIRAESAADARAVAEMAWQAGAQFILGAADVPAYAHEQALSLEAAARRLRYRFLFEQAARTQAQAVCTGHTADDQVETVLMHLLRGAGSAGLGGMHSYSLPNAWSQSIPLVRPLLDTWREEIEAYLAEHDLHALQDATNQDTRFARNRLRHAVIPYLESYNPRLRPALWRLAEVLRAENAVLGDLVEAAWQECLRASDPAYLAFDAPALGKQPLGVQRAVLRRALENLRPALDLDYEAIQQAVQFLHKPPRSRSSDLAAGLRLLHEDGLLWLAAWEADLPGGNWPQIPEDGEYTLPLPGTLDLPGGWQLRVSLPTEIEDARRAAWNNHADPYQAWLDLESLPRPLRLRPRRPGQRIQPLGMGGHSLKLSDLMINNRLPRRARPGWPLLIAGEQVAWVPGLRLAHPFRVRQDSQEILHIELGRSNLE